MTFVDGDVVHASARVIEDEVARSGVSARDATSNAVLRLSVVRQADVELAIEVERQTRAVERARAGRAVTVALTDVAQRAACDTVLDAGDTTLARCGSSRRRCRQHDSRSDGKHDAHGAAEGSKEPFGGSDAGHTTDAAEVVKAAVDRPMRETECARHPRVRLLRGA